jgi:hypothetical protein
VGVLTISLQPLNDHELAIAQTVDRIAGDGTLHLTSIPKVAAALDFMMYRSDSEFLVRYIRWRMDHPIVK